MFRERASERKTFRVLDDYQYYPEVQTAAHNPNGNNFRIASTSTQLKTRPAMFVVEEAWQRPHHRNSVGERKLRVRQPIPRRYKTTHNPGPQRNSKSLHSLVDRGAGNRGHSCLSWRLGPREATRPPGGGNNYGSWSLFVDCIPQGMTSRWLRSIFEKDGCVDDVFISKKIRDFTYDAFGFVRFSSVQEAENAISNLNGLVVRGRKLRVSMAKY
ncbi:uncharacterized protein LOC130818419 [Amaranthus tricolor]|uniref:uncharacterized protein LOC130818419 n=1 Tax=Amaranthus tricolor TaxID=29722 RepID=UPI0025843C45|nr:uncharacterized protein LOC130818419 [Amaranthus tricolor]